jgi:hypothetical protein
MVRAYAGIVALVMAVSPISAVSPQEIPRFKAVSTPCRHQRAVRLAPGVDG